MHRTSFLSVLLQSSLQYLAAASGPTNPHIIPHARLAACMGVVSNPGLASLAPAYRHLACLASLLCPSCPAGSFSLISLRGSSSPRPTIGKNSVQQAGRPAFVFGLFANVCRFPPLFLLLPPADSWNFIIESVCLSDCLLFPVLQLSRPAIPIRHRRPLLLNSKKYARALEHRSRRGCRRTELDHSRVVSTPKFRFCVLVFPDYALVGLTAFSFSFQKIFPILFSAFVSPVHIISARATQVPRAARAPWRESSSLPLVRSQNSILPASRSGMLTARQKGQRQGRKDRQAGRQV